MTFHLDYLLTTTFTLFAVIDIVGSIPLLISLKDKMGGIRSTQATLISGLLMIVFLFAGEAFLKILGLDIRSFAVGGSVVIFLLGLEMVLGHEILKEIRMPNRVQSYLLHSQLLQEVVRLPRLCL